MANENDVFGSLNATTTPEGTAKVTQELIQAGNLTTKVEEYQVPDYITRQQINSQIK